MLEVVEEGAMVGVMAGAMDNDNHNHMAVEDIEEALKKLLALLKAKKRVGWSNKCLKICD